MSESRLLLESSLPFLSLCVAADQLHPFGKKELLPTEKSSTVFCSNIILCNFLILRFFYLLSYNTQLLVKKDKDFRIPQGCFWLDINLSLFLGIYSIFIYFMPIFLFFIITVNFTECYPIFRIIHPYHNDSFVLLPFNTIKVYNKFIIIKVT